MRDGVTVASLDSGGGDASAVEVAFVVEEAGRARRRREGSFTRMIAAVLTRGTSIEIASTTRWMRRMSMRTRW